MSTTTILLADDHTIVRQAIRTIFEGQTDTEVIGEASTGMEAIEKCAALKPDIVLMDISMPDMNGIEATRRLAKEHPGCNVVILSMHKERQYVFPALQAGAKGFVLKDDMVADLFVAVHAVSNGRSYFSPTVQDCLRKDYIGAGNDMTKRLKADPLTCREKQVLQLIAEECTSKQIAAKLDLSLKTVQAHRTNAMRKLDIHSTAGLTKYAIAMGLVPKPGSAADN